MTKVRLVAVVCALGVVLAPVARAQEPAKPGPEHDQLKKLVGHWDATIDMAGNQSKGTVTYKMDLGGLWLVSDFKGEFGGQKFSGKGLDSYDAQKKKYIGVWCDSMSASPIVSEGTFDKESKTMSMIGEGPGPDGKPAKYKMVSKWKDDDTMVFTMSGPGQDEVVMTITYKRKK